MKRTLTLGLAAFAVVVVLVIAKMISDGAGPTTSTPKARDSVAATQTPATPSPTLPPTPPPTPPVLPVARTEADGKEVSTDYGVVQVRVTVADQRIQKVQVLKLPDANPMDKRLSRDAAAKLELAIVEAQSAEVDAVSGATYTSDGYLQSAQSALDQIGS